MKKAWNLFSSVEKYNKKILYVIDMVKGFVNEGVMHDDYIANSIEEQISLIKKFIKEQCWQKNEFT